MDTWISHYILPIKNLQHRKIYLVLLMLPLTNNLFADCNNIGISLNSASYNIHSLELFIARYTLFLADLFKDYHIDFLELNSTMLPLLRKSFMYNP